MWTNVGHVRNTLHHPNDDDGDNNVMLGKGSSTNDLLAEKITELQIKYQSRYACPKCGMKFPFTTHWKKLEADGKCPNPKCNAEFIKKQ